GAEAFTITAVTKITATAAKFYASMEGADYTFDTSSTDYPILSYISTTVVYLTGDATGEASGDTFTITSAGRYRLPDDYGGIEGPLTFAANEGYFAPISIVSEHQLRQLLQNSISTGRPVIGAIVPLSTTGVAGQRWDLKLGPIPSETDVLYFRYSPFVDALSATKLHALGGMAFSQVVMASCLAEAEFGRYRQRGPKYQDFLVKLRTAIDDDRRNHSADRLGYMGDPGVGYGASWYMRNHVVTVDGVSYP
ncbi:MAG: hypothetical protein ACYSWU_19565, partial [Planctomycetota bacterium]